MKYVFIVKRNSDTNEGRGPMVIDSIWDEGAEDAAIEYMDKQPGVQGRRGKWSTEKYGDWTIEKVVVQTSADDMLAVKQEKIRQGALRKLTSIEREALGV
jgi:hypothetical protein